MKTCFILKLRTKRG